MAEKSSWQSQNFSKSSGSSGPSSMNSKIAVNSAQLHSKIAKPTVQNYCNGGMVKKYADGTPGGVQDDVTGVDARVEAVKADNANSDWAANENYGDGTTADQRREMTGTGPKVATADEVIAASKSSEAAPEAGKKMSFGEAFKAARERGDSTFTWDGKPGTTFSTAMASSKGVSKPAPAAPKAESKPAAAPAASASESKPATKTFAEDVAERKRNAVANSMAADVNYGHEGNRPVQKKSSGRGVIDTSNIDPKTLLPKK